MKFLLIFFLICFVLCEPPKIVPAEESFSEIKKQLLECISNDEKASEGLRKYAKDNINAGYKETLVLTKYRENDSDRFVIRQCRRKAFLLSSKNRMKTISMVPRE